MDPSIGNPARRDDWLNKRSDEHFSSLANNLNELAGPVRQMLSEALQADEGLLLVIKAPYQGVLAARERDQRQTKKLPWKFTPDWVLVLTSRRLLLVQIEDSTKAPQVDQIPLANILSIQNGTILLFSWFELCWAENGSVRRQKIYFNAVCESFFTRLTAMIRAAWPTVSADGCPACGLDALPFKFKNLLKLRVFLPAEQAQGLLLRPSLWKTRLGIFRQMTAPRATLALTGSCLVLAEEDRDGRDGSYGFIFTCLPRQYINELVVRSSETGPCLHMVLRYAGAAIELDLPFPAQSEAALHKWVQPLMAI